MQDTLYYKDNYLKEFNTKVIDCFEENDKIVVFLEETAFYPEGGGQPSDIGTIDDINVLHVIEKENMIYHIVDKKIEIGKEVNCKIDFKNRFLNMQHHTAEHIISGLICEKYNCNNVGFHMGKDYVTMDFDVNLNKSQIEEIEIKANEVVFRNVEIIVKLVSDKEAEKIDYRSKKKLTGMIRFIEVPGADLCACCGIHVKRTGEIGLIKLISVEKYKVGSRIYMLCGARALENYNNEYEQMNKLSVLLSSKHEDIYNTVVDLKEEIKNMKIKNNNLQTKLFEKEVEELENKDVNIMFKEKLSSNDIQNLCRLLKEKSFKFAVVFSKENNNSYKYVLMSENYDVRQISKSLNEIFSGKGGGKENLCQGSIFGEEEKIKEYLNNL